MKKRVILVVIDFLICSLKKDLFLSLFISYLTPNEYYIIIFVFKIKNKNKEIHPVQG